MTVTPIRPEPLLTWADYREDIKARWTVHVYEVAKLMEDVRKAYDVILPFCRKSIDQLVETYKRLVPVK